jgi:hypothetical protein
MHIGDSWQEEDQFAVFVATEALTLLEQKPNWPRLGMKWTKTKSIDTSWKISATSSTLK